MSQEVMLAPLPSLFDLENRELKEVATELFANSLRMLRTLGSHFIPEEDWNSS